MTFKVVTLTSILSLTRERKLTAALD